MFNRVGYVDGREWSAMVAVVCAWLLAAVMAGVLAVRAVRVVRGWMERERVEWLDESRESRSTSAAPELSELGAVYPEPVCEWCGGIMDGHSCQCEGGEL